MNVVAFDSEFGSGKDNPVVVADDDSNQVFEIAEFLERRGIDVVPAFDGESAIAAIEKHRPAVALIDVNMPGWDGIRVAEIVRHLDHKLALILMSGDSEAIVRANRNHEGAFAVIEKPLAMKHVAHFIEAALLRDSASR
ncbi:MAG: response regulator [Alphaproteobacteria bacterium]